jgi:hypothetical protein
MAAAAFEQAKELLIQLEQEEQEDAWLAEWGLMPSAAGNNLRASVWSTVIEPCTKALLTDAANKVAASA